MVNTTILTDLSARLLGQVNADPDTSQLPGGQVLQNLTDGVMGWALILALVALLASSAAWALGANSQNHHYTTAGKRGVMVSGLAALLIGAAPAIINFFFNSGSGVS